ncbi:unnamed protein product [Adineta steineri]|uniref:Uncharacterized protein n=1 Tax=Adineta steineri TaxID=433720 RepID=A0A820RJ24_9BILA|nr:unnamed protein product [Adineta steineri]
MVIYDVSQVRHKLLVANSIFIAGRNREVQKVMFYRPEWLKTYYIQPMLTITVAIEQQKRRQAINDLLDFFIN